jgi:hypothetical protein
MCSEHLVLQQEGLIRFFWTDDSFTEFGPWPFLIARISNYQDDLRALDFLALDTNILD